jgi:hypothetical protein
MESVLNCENTVNITKNVTLKTNVGEAILSSKQKLINIAVMQLCENFINGCGHH